MQITRCTLEDIKELQYIARKTFAETFADGNTEEDLNNYLDEAYALDVLKEELEHPDSITYLARDNDTVLGYLKLNKGTAQSEEGFDGSLEIQRIYVSKEAKGKGIGTQFMNIAFDTAKEWNCSWAWLGVWEHNPAAIRFYTNKGFTQFSSHTFIVGDDKQTDYLLKKELK